LCRELRARYAAFCAKSLADVELLVLFLDAVYLPTRPSGAKKGVLVASGYDRGGERVLLAVRLGQREAREDWLDLGRDLTRRGLCCPSCAYPRPCVCRNDCSAPRDRCRLRDCRSAAGH
jgi:transposase-like protein